MAQGAPYAKANLFVASLPIDACPYRQTRLVAFLLIFLTLTASPVWSHSNHNADSGITVSITPTASNPASDSESNSDLSTTFPLKVGGAFKLIDHHGKWVTNESYKGRHLLVFFGYIGCQSMCSISLARIGKALTLLGDSINKLAPLVITVDPERDTPEVMKAALYKFHPHLVGLTGKPDMLKEAYQNYQQKPAVLGNWDTVPVISHSSYIYLMDKNGEFVTLFPPILNPPSMAKIIRKYIDAT